MKLDLKFYKTLVQNILPSTSETDQGKIVFDHTNGRIGANGSWFGDSSDKLPLVGGTMSGDINLNSNSININSSTSVVNNITEGRPAISWKKRNGRDAIEIGNPFMHLRLSTGQGGNLFHYYRHTGQNTEYESLILDSYNTKISNYNDNNIQYGYTLTLPQNSNNSTNTTKSFNLLGVGNLHPSISIDEYGQLKISVGGEDSTTIGINASNFAGNHYFVQDSKNENNTDIPIDAIKTVIGTKISTNNITLGEGLVIEKIPSTENGTITNNPKSYNIKISIDPSILNRIKALEERYDVTFEIN